MGRSIVKQGRLCVLGAGTVSGRGPLQVVSACYPSATQLDLRVASNARNLHGMGITSYFLGRNTLWGIADIAPAAGDVAF